MDALAHAFETQILPVLVSLLVAVAIALLGIGAHAVRVYQQRAVAWLANKAKTDAQRAALAKLDDAVRSAVNAVEQTVAKDLRGIAPEIGKLTPAQAQKTLEAALDAARGHLGPQLWSELADTLELGPAGLEGLLRTRIEAAVFEVRQGIRSLTSAA
jgi:hypothetical protein